ncbi:hypothetical protein GCM10009554_65410 [Kribbella koreensis]|uniref:Barstar (barnase inhibitor) domain-containing protein n=1 Tax=Kribbella koreensis TaxID=57909 RepID=A0ABP4BX08_9ACTN
MTGPLLEYAGGWVKRHTWQHALPLRFLLVAVDADDEEQLWASCTAAEGLFVEPPSPPREVLTVRGCKPDGAFKEALAAAEASYQGLGDVGVDVWDGDQPVQWWTLKDVAVLAQLPDSGDSGLYDLVIGAGVVPDADSCRPPKAPGFELFAPGQTVGGSRCSAIDGLFRSRPDPAAVPLELIGCEPTELLLGRADTSGWGRLLVLDRDGAVMAAVALGLDIAEVRPSVIGAAFVDITLTDGGDERPLPAVRPIWDRWYESPPAEPNLWAPYDSQGRSAWIELSTHAWRTPPPGPDLSGGEYHLDGRFVTDHPGLHCAMAEALLGPGSYFGRERNAFSDCLCGGFGVVPPFTLNWHDSDVARQAFAGGRGERLTYFEEVVRLLERYGVTVVLR